jgi:uncharacterized protein involved in response to NO
MPTVLALWLVELSFPRPWAVVAAASTAVLVHGARLYGWYTPPIWKLPILWVLYLGYAWLIVGFALRALVALGIAAGPPSLHAFTVGAIGVMTLGMMARVALGHTGRAMRAAGATVAAFVLVNLAALVRILAPVGLPGSYRTWIIISGGLWICAFALFLLVYAPVLTRARVDGRPG